MQQDQKLKAATKYAHTRLKEAGLFVFGLAKGTEFERSLMSYNVHKVRNLAALGPTRPFDKARRDELPPITVLTQMLFNAATTGKDPQAACALLEMAVNLLDRGEKLPDPLRIYVVLALRSYALTLSKKHGRKIRGEEHVRPQQGESPPHRGRQSEAGRCKSDAERGRGPGRSLPAPPELVDQSFHETHYIGRSANPKPDWNWTTVCGP